MELIIKNGTIITATDTYKADIAVKNGKIALIGQDLQFEGAEVVDASGKYVLPGALDAHTHLEMPFGGTTSADSYESGTRAAACGCVTTVFDFVIQRKGQGLIEAVEGRNALCAPQACVDYAFHTAITDLRPEILDEIEKSVEYGVPSFKVFMVYKKEGMMVDDGVLCAILEKSKETGALVSVHAENPDLIDKRIEKFLAEGKTSA